MKKRETVKRSLYRLALILKHVQKLERQERAWLYRRLSDVECR